MCDELYNVYLETVENFSKQRNKLQVSDTSTGIATVFEHRDADKVYLVLYLRNASAIVVDWAYKSSIADLNT